MIGITTPDDLNGAIAYLLAGARVFGTLAQFCGPEGERRYGGLADWLVDAAEPLEALAKELGCLPDPATLHTLVCRKAAPLWDMWECAYEEELQKCP